MPLKFSNLLLTILLLSSSQSYAEDAPRNIRIDVGIVQARGVRQGMYESTHQSTQTQVIVVMEGKEGRIFIGKEVPRVEYYRNWLANEGYLEGQIVFRDVGTQLAVTPRIIGDKIEVTITPEVAYETGEGPGTIALTRLSTTVQLRDGQSYEIGGGRRQSDFMDNFYRTQTGETVRIILTPRLLDY